MSDPSGLKPVTFGASPNGAGQDYSRSFGFALDTFFGRVRLGSDYSSWFSVSYEKMLEENRNDDADEAEDGDGEDQNEKEDENDEESEDDKEGENDEKGCSGNDCDGDGIADDIEDLLVVILLDTSGVGEDNTSGGLPMILGNTIEELILVLRCWGFKMMPLTWQLRSPQCMWLTVCKRSRQHKQQG